MYADLLQVDEPLAWELQHEEGLPHTSTGVHNISHPVTKPPSIFYGLNIYFLQTFFIRNRTPVYTEQGKELKIVFR